MLAFPQWNVKTWTKELAPWRQHFSKGSCCFPLQLKISSQVAIMAIENGIVAMAMHTFTHSTNPIFVNKTLHKVRRLVYAGRLGVVWNALHCICLPVSDLDWPCFFQVTPGSATQDDAPSPGLELLSSWAAAQLNKPFKHQAGRHFGSEQDVRTCNR